MQVKLTSNGEILFLDGDHLNRNSLNRKTLIVTPQTALATRESIWVQFGDDKDYENANANILEPIRLSEVEGNYKIIIPDEVIKKPGTWYMTLAVRMYSTNGAVYTEQLTSDKVSFTVNDSFPVSDREYASNGTIEDMWQQILFADQTVKESAESAAESAAQAQTAQAGAEAARAAAVASAENAQAAKNEAFVSAANAQKYLEDVNEARDQVSDYKDEVDTAIIYIRNMGLEIAQDVTNAENSASAAASSASAAAQSAGQSAQSALQAQEYAQQAQEYAQKHYEIVASYDALPQPGNSAYIYLVPSSTASGADNYEEYLWITNTSSYEFIGTTSDVDLSNYAQVNGTYSGMTVGAVVATQLTNQDIHDFQGSEYWGKTYFGAGGNAVQNKPEGVDGFYLEVLRGGTSTTIHRLIATADASGESVSPNIYIEQYITSWSSWEEVATSDGTYNGMTVGNATNASQLGSIPAANYAQIDGSYAGLTSGQAEMLTDPFTVGRDTPTATSGYVKFATVSLPMEYRAGVARFEILDKNYVNTQTLPCGIELAARNLGTGSCTIHANLLYGSSYYLSKIYACVKTGIYPITADLYYDMTSDNPQNTLACVKPLFTYFRASNTSFTFITDNEIVPSLPTDTTNTLLSDIYTPVTEAETANVLYGEDIPSDSNLNDFKPTFSEHFRYYKCSSIAVAQTLINCPVTAPFSMIVGAPQVSGGRFVQFIMAVGGGMLYSRYCDNNTWSSWREIVNSNGNYPNLGAGYLAKRATVYVNTSNAAGWRKFGEIKITDLASVTGTSSYSAIFKVNGVNPYVATSANTNTANSGDMEIDIRLDGGIFSTTIAPSIKFLSGYIDPDKFCFVKNDDVIYFYVNMPCIYERYVFVIIDESYSAGATVNVFTFKDEFYGATAPDGAVYAVVRNNASYADQAGNAATATDSEKLGGVLATNYAINTGTYTGMTVGKAVNDGEGNNIVETYLTKVAAGTAAPLYEHTFYYQGGVGMSSFTGNIALYVSCLSPVDHAPRTDTEQHTYEDILNILCGTIYFDEIENTRVTANGFVSGNMLGSSINTNIFYMVLDPIGSPDNILGINVLLGTTNSANDGFSNNLLFKINSQSEYLHLLEFIQNWKVKAV